jgi:tRNA-dihydrouridine synthase B
MVSAKALVYQDKKSRALLKLGEDEHPAAAQIFGSEPEVMAEGAARAIEISGADILDINMGCPTGKIVKNGEGCALMQNPELAMKIIEAVVSAVSVPVTVKIRKGWDKGSVNAAEFAKMAEEAGASAIAVHGRTRSQLYSGIADWDIIAEVKKAVGIPVIANGDVFTPEDAVRILKRTGADMVMIGRGALGNPWIFKRAEAAIGGKEIPKIPPLTERCDTAVRQFELAKEDKGEKIACLEARKHYAWYLHGVPHSGYYKEQISKVSSMDDIYRITEEIKRELR